MNMVIFNMALTAANIVLIVLLLVACFLDRRKKEFTFWFSLFLCSVMALDILAIWAR